LVNIRFTLDAAKLAGVISQQSSDAILQQASSLHFSMRSFSNVLKSLRDADFDSKSLDSFEQWLPGGKVDQKRADALLLLEHLKTLERLPVPAYAPDFHFETTEIWSGALLQSQAEARRAAPLSAKSQAILEQLQKDQSVFESVKESALLRLFMKQFSAFTGSTLSDSSDTNFVDDVSRQRVRQKIDEFRRQHNLWDREAINNWLHDNDVELMRFESLMHHEAWLDDLMQEPLSPGLQSAIIDYLRVSGDYSTLSEQLCDRALTDPA